MKKIFRNIILLSCFVAFASVILSGCNSDDDSYLVRETDKIVFDSNLASSRNISLRCVGEWRTIVPEGAEWVSTYPENGVGDGSFKFIEVRAADNRGVDREATIYLECGGKQYPINVRQANGEIKWGETRIYGTMKQDEESEAQISVQYEKSFGDEVVTVRGVISGDVEGISVGPEEVNLEKGSGQIVVNIKGKPSKDGDVVIYMYVGDKAVGFAKTTILKPDEKPVEDFPVVWNFCPVKGDASVKAALTAAHPEWLGEEHYCNSDVGNGRISVVEAVGKTATPLSLWGFNDGHLYFKGLYYKDWILFTMPVKHLPSGTRLKFKGSIGGSGSAAAFFMIEYSVDGQEWFIAEDVLNGTFNDKTFDYHLQAVDGTTTEGEKAGNFENYITVNKPISNGTLYVRLRVCGNVRVNLSSTVTTTGGGSNRLKGTNSFMLAD